MLSALYIWNISTAPMRCKIANILSALKYLSAIKPIMNGAMMAPHDWVENTDPVCTPVAFKLLAKNGPKDTNHPPQIKNSRNIMTDNLIRIEALIWLF